MDKGDFCERFSRLGEVLPWGIAPHAFQRLKTEGYAMVYDLTVNDKSDIKPLKI